MKIIQINTVYGTGSTGKIVASLYSLAKDNDFEARVAYGRGNSPEKMNIDGYLIGNKPDFYRHVLYNFLIGSGGFASKAKTKRFLQWLDKEKPDLLHLHNLHGFYIHVGMLFKYIKDNGIPVIWTLHDCWSFTGQCAHFDYIGCEKWKNGCHHCQIYRSDYPYSLFRDNSQTNYLLKKTAFCGVPNLTIVTPSRWLADLVKQSYLKEYPVEVIPNGIDLNVFHPASHKDDDPDQNIKILLGVANVWDSHKGLSYLLQLSDEFNPSNGYQVVIIGLSKQQIKKIHKEYGDRVLALPKTSSQSELASWYQKTFIYINPTLQDNFPTTNLEALACGTPVVTFKTGGSPESIADNCGIVVAKGDLSELKNAIHTICANNADKNGAFTTGSCRMQAENYNAAVQFSNYIHLYRQYASHNLREKSFNQG